MEFEVPCECGRRRRVTAGDAGATLRCECGRAIQVPGLRELQAFAPVPTDVPTQPVPARSAQLTGVDLAVCLFLPVVGFIAGVLRLLRGEPTAGRMMLVSGAWFVLIGFLYSFLKKLPA